MSVYILANCVLYVGIFKVLQFEKSMELGAFSVENRVCHEVGKLKAFTAART